MDPVNMAVSEYMCVYFLPAYAIHHPLFPRYLYEDIIPSPVASDG